jgi:hypothetical protein
MLRDYPQYFEIDQGPINVLTIRLPHPLVMSSSLQVYLTAGTPPATALTDAWQLDDRNGLLKLTEEGDLGKRCLVAGYHFSWFSDADLAFHCGRTLSEMTHNGTPVDSFSEAEVQVIAMGGVVNALWSLAMELALDIDVSTPEGMFIPARQRYSQVIQMINVWENEFQTKSSLLNIGLGSLDVYRLRRVALMTGRYVPVYREREFDDPRPPERQYPAIPYGPPAEPSSSDDIVELATWDMLQ